MRCWCCMKQSGERKRVEKVAVKLVSRMKISGCNPFVAPKRVSFKEEERFIDQCIAADVEPEDMIHFLAYRLTQPLDDRAVVEQLHSVLCEQLRADRIRVIAQDYEMNHRSFARLRTSCAAWGIDIEELADHFDPLEHTGTIADVPRSRRLADAVRGGRDFFGGD
jgi:hypothetical protein